VNSGNSCYRRGVSNLTKNRGPESTSGEGTYHRVKKNSPMDQGPDYENRSRHLLLTIQLLAVHGVAVVFVKENVVRELRGSEGNAMPRFECLSKNA